MPRLAPEAQIARREHILDAAERCFTENGFHPTTMHDICEEAGVSPGGLYTYFASKDDLIVGLCEREKERFARQLAQLSTAEDFFLALRAMAEHYCCEEPAEKVRLHVEIGAEAGRNAVIRETVRNLDTVVRDGFAELLHRECDRGRINPQFPVETVVRAMSVLGDGLFWHRALDPSFDPAPIIPAMMAMVSALLAPVSSGQAGESSERMSSI